MSLPLLWLFLLLSTVAGVPQEPMAPPLLEQELFTLVRAKALFTEQQLLEAIRMRGIGFRLTDSVRKALKKDGATPAVLAELEKAAERLKRRSTADEARAAAALPKPPPPPLDEAAQRRLFEEVRKNALEYTEKLPNFICVQVIKRMVNPNGGYWVTDDVIQARVAYNDHKETYQVVTVNNQLTNREFDSLGGATSTGEFGTMLLDLFKPETRAEFTWVGPEVQRGRPVYEYDYYVSKERSTFTITWRAQGVPQRSIVSAYRGRVSIDPETRQVVVLRADAENIPEDFPIRATSNLLEYDYATIAGRSFLLPARATMEMREGRWLMRNEIQFRQYRRFTAEARVLDFDEPIEPEPPKPQPPKSEPPKPKP